MKTVGIKAWALFTNFVRVLAYSARNDVATPRARHARGPARGRRRVAVALFAVRVLVLVVSVIASFAIPVAAGTASASTSPTISADQADYPPGATVTLTGAGWQPGEAVALTVNDSVGNTWIWNDNLTADSSGDFTDFLQLPNYFVSNYAVAATGSVSGTATTTFTDAVKLAIAGSDNATTHTSAAQQENLGSVLAGSTLSLTCPRGNGLTVSASGLGSSNTLGWSLGYVSSAENDAALSPVTTFTGNSGTFTASSQSQCVAVSIATGALSAGTYQGELEASRASGVTATAGDYFFAFTVTARATSASVSCTPSSLLVGTSTSCTATVTDTDTGAKSWPQGTISWSNNGGGGAAGHFSSSTCTLAQEGTQPASQCTVNYTPTASGGQTILGSYVPSDGVHASGGAGQTISVSSTQTTATTVTSSKNPSSYGDSVTFTATIAPSPSGAGTVAFTDGATTLCGAAAVTGNTATCTTSSLSVSGSPHTITASYSGATGFTSSSGSVSQTVNKATPTCTVTG
jgi:hypothetical protein